MMNQDGYFLQLLHDESGWILLGLIRQNLDTVDSCYMMNPDGYFLVDSPKSGYSGQLLHDESGWILFG
jgi:hypothetical protein